MSVLTLVPPPRPDISIPELLRELAAGMESGLYAMPEAMVYVAESEDGLTAGMLGRTSEVHGCGLLAIGMQFLAQEAAPE